MERKKKAVLEEKQMYQIYRSCRTCGAGAGYKMPIIQQILPNDVDVETELKDKIRECVDIAVSKDDKMPPLICELCVDKVNDFYEFREMCLQVDKRTRTKLGLPPQATPSGSADASDCILGLTSQVYVNPREEDEEKVTPKSKKKSIPKITFKKEDKGWNKSVEAESPATRSSRHSKMKTTARPGPKSKKKVTRYKREPTPPPLPKEKPLSFLRNSRSKICTPSPPPKERSSKRSLDKSIEPEPKSVKKVRIKSPSPSPPPTRSEKRRSVTFSPAASGAGKKPKQATPDKRLERKPERVPEKRSEKSMERRHERANEKRNARITEKCTAKNVEKRPETRPVSTCDLCGQTYTTKNLRSHLISMHSPTVTSERQSCAACGEWFDTVEGGLAHHKWHRATGAPYRCAKCQADYKTTQAYNRHAQLGQCIEESVVPDVRCDQCWHEFATDTWMSLHKCGGADARPGGKCWKCNKTFVKYKQQMRHEQSCTRREKKNVLDVNPDNPYLACIRPIHVRVEPCDRLLQNIKLDTHDGDAGDKYDVSQVHPEFGYAKNYTYPYRSCAGTLRLKTEDGYLMEGMKQEILNEMYDSYDEDCVDGYSSSDDVSPSDVVINPFAVRDTKGVERLSSISLRVVFSEKFLAYGNPPRRKRRKILKSMKTDREAAQDMTEKENAESPFDSLLDTSDKSLEEVSKSMSDETDLPKSATNECEALECATDEVDAPVSVFDETEKDAPGSVSDKPGDTESNETKVPEGAQEKTQPSESVLDETQASEIALNGTQDSKSSLDETQSLESTLDETQASESALNGTQDSKSSLDETQSLESTLDETQASGSALDETQASESAPHETQDSKSSLDETQASESALDEIQASESALDETQASESALDETQDSESALDETQASERALDNRQTSESALEETRASESALDETQASESALDETQASEGALDETQTSEKMLDETQASEYALDETWASGKALDETQNEIQSSSEILESDMDEVRVSGRATDESEVSKSARDRTAVSKRDIDETHTSEGHENGTEDSLNDANDCENENPDEKSDFHENIDAIDVQRNDTDELLNPKKNCSDSKTVGRDETKHLVVEEKSGENGTDIDHAITSEVLNEQHNADDITGEIDRFLRDDVNGSKHHDGVTNTDKMMNENCREVESVPHNQDMGTEKSETNVVEPAFSEDVPENELSTGNYENSEPRNDISEDSNYIGLGGDGASRLEDETKIDSDTRKVLDESDLNDAISQASSKILTDENSGDLSGVPMVSDKNEFCDDFEVERSVRNVDDNTDSNLDYGDEASLLKSPESNDNSSKSIKSYASDSRDNVSDENVAQTNQNEDSLQLDNISDDDFEFN